MKWIAALIVWLWRQSPKDAVLLVGGTVACMLSVLALVFVP